MTAWVRLTSMGKPGVKSQMYVSGVQETRLLNVFMLMSSVDVYGLCLFLMEPGIGPCKVDCGISGHTHLPF